MGGKKTCLTLSQRITRLKRDSDSKYNHCSLKILQANRQHELCVGASERKWGLINCPSFPWGKKLTLAS